MEEINVYEVVLEPQSPLASSLSANTVFGALCWAVYLLYGEGELNNLLSCIKKGELLLSSPMPESKRGKKYFFFPLLPFLLEGKSKEGNVKKVKSLKYIPEGEFCVLLEYLRKKRKFLVNLYEVFSDDSLENLQREVGSLFSKVYSSRVKLDSLTTSTGSGGDFFFHPSLYLKTNLFVFVACSKKTWELLEPAFRLLADLGLGAEKSVGYGRFRIKRMGRALGYEKVFRLREGGDLFITLSPVLATDRIDYEESFYEVFPFRGALEGTYGVSGNIWKPWLFYLKEGSIIKKKECLVAGGLFEFSENGQKNYTYGVEFPVFI